MRDSTSLRNESSSAQAASRNLARFSGSSSMAEWNISLIRRQCWAAMMITLLSKREGFRDLYLLTRMREVDSLKKPESLRESGLFIAKPGPSHLPVALDRSMAFGYNIRFL